MMRRYFAYLLLLIVAVCIGLVISADPGYALFSYHHTTVEMPLWLASMIAITVFIVLATFLRLIDNTRYLLHRISYWRQKRKLLKIQKQTEHGMLDLFEGRFQAAEKQLQSTTHHQDTPLINYLTAAQAANALGAYDRRDAYLNQAKEKQPKATTAIIIIQAQLQIDKHQLLSAQYLLEALYKKKPKHEMVLQLLKTVYIKQENWGKLSALLPRLIRYRLISDTETEALQGYVQSHALTTSLDPTKTWCRLNRHLRKQPALVIAYVDALIHIQEYTQAKEAIENYLKREWLDALCERYADLETNETDKQLKFMEKRLSTQPENAVLLATLGKLSYRLKMWGKAKTYYQHSLAIKPSIEIYTRLGQLLEQLGESAEALKQYRTGLLHSDSKLQSPLA